MIRLLLEPVNLLILDEPTNHLDMPSKDVLKEAIQAFDGTAIIVSHDREFLDGLVTKVFEFGDGKVREHIGGIYDFLRQHDIDSLDMLGNKTLAQSTVDSDNSINTKLSANTKQSASEDNTKKDGMQSYVERKEQMKAINRTKKAIAATEKKIESMEIRLKELDDLLCDPKNASDMTMVNEYTDIKRNIDVEIEKWEKLSEELESLSASL